MIRSGQFGRKSLSYVAAAGVPALAERGQRRQAAVGVDRQRSEPARRAAPGPADAEGQRPPGAVRLADRQAGREVGAGDGGRPAGARSASLIAYRKAADGGASRSRCWRELPFRWDLLADAAKGPLVWKAIARQMGPQALRMNLNTLLRHEVLRATPRWSTSSRPALPTPTRSAARGSSRTSSWRRT